MNNYCIDAHIGEDTEVIVYFDYSPYEPQTYWEPGCDSEVEINEVIDSNGVDITDHITEEERNSLEMKCFEQMERCDDEH